MPVRSLTRTTLLIISRVEQLFADKKLYLRSSTDSDVTLAALLRSSCRTSRSIVTLVRAGFGANALGLSRSLIETWITIRWLTNQNTDRRSSRFCGFNSKLRERIIHLIGEYYPSFDLNPYKGNKGHEQRAKEYTRWDAWGPGVKSMATEEEIFQDGLKGPASPEFAYNIAFFASSYYLHPTSLGLHHHFLRHGEVLDFNPRSDEAELARQALNLTCQSLIQSALRIGLYWDAGTEEALISLWDRYVNCPD